MLARFKPLVMILALCAGLPWVSGCGSHSFDVVRTAQANLSAGDDASTMAFDGFAPMTIMTDRILTLQRVARRQLAGVHVHAVTLTVRTPGATQDLTFLDSVDVVISAAGLPDQTLATGQSFTGGQNMGVLKVADGDFLAYFSKADPTISVSGQGQVPIDMTLEAEIAFALEISSGTILFQ